MTSNDVYEMYYCEGTACLAPHMVLEVLGVPYRLIKTDIFKGEHQTPEYLAVNPYGRIPSLRLPNGEIMTEAAAICLHLADTHPDAQLSPPVESGQRPRFLKSLIFLATAIQGAYKRFYYPERYSTDTQHAPSIEAQSMIELTDLWSIVDEDLRAHGRPFHMGERMTVPDLYLTMLATWYAPPEDLFAKFPSVGACYDAVTTHPGIAKCMGLQSKISVGVLSEES